VHCPRLCTTELLHYHMCIFCTCIVLICILHVHRGCTNFVNSMVASASFDISCMQICMNTHDHAGWCAQQTEHTALPSQV
jgi:hypothetical protein